MAWPLVEDLFVRLPCSRLKGKFRGVECPGGVEFWRKTSKERAVVKEEIYHDATSGIPLANFLLH